MLHLYMDVVTYFELYYFRIIFFFNIGGILGAFMTGLFSEKWVNDANGFDGAFYGQPIQLWYQMVGILTAIGE